MLTLAILVWNAGLRLLLLCSSSSQEPPTRASGRVAFVQQCRMSTLLFCQSFCPAICTLAAMLNAGVQPRLSINAISNRDDEDMYKVR